MNFDTAEGTSDSNNLQPMKNKVLVLQIDIYDANAGKSVNALKFSPANFALVSLIANPDRITKIPYP